MSPFVFGWPPFFFTPRSSPPPQTPPASVLDDGVGVCTSRTSRSDRRGVAAADRRGAGDSEEEVVAVGKSLLLVTGRAPAVVQESDYHGNPQPSFLGVITHILGA